MCSFDGLEPVKRRGLRTWSVSCLPCVWSRFDVGWFDRIDDRRWLWSSWDVKVLIAGNVRWCSCHWLGGSFVLGFSPSRSVVRGSFVWALVSSLWRFLAVFVFAFLVKFDDWRSAAFFVETLKELSDVAGDWGCLRCFGLGVMWSLRFRWVRHVEPCLSARSRQKWWIYKIYDKNNGGN